jgi:transmembrane sensor
MADQKNEKRLKELEAKWLNGTITPEEAHEYAEWYNDDNDQPLNIPVNIAENEEQHRLKMLNQIHNNTAQKKTPIKTLYKYAAAAAILIVIGTTIFYNYQTASNKTAKSIALINDVLPATDKAILTLSTGQKIELSNQQQLTDGRTIINNTNGQLSYSNPERGSFSPFEKGGSGSEHNATLRGGFNTISTPRGGKYTVKLPDGSKVWLNAASSITFPTVFTTNKREVSTTGEAFFEITKNAGQPFIVTTNNQMKIQVMGTSFNINAYANENEIRTTLIEGKVKILSANKSLTLNPGEQSNYTQEKLIRSENIDIEKVLSWKQNRFVFESDKISAIMRELERWYDVDIIIEGNNKDELFSGILNRDKNVSDVFKMLQKAGNIQYRIERKKIYVKP